LLWGYWVTSLSGSSISLNRKQTIFWRYSLHCDLWLVVAVFQTSQSWSTEPKSAEETCVPSIAGHCRTDLDAGMLMPADSVDYQWKCLCRTNFLPAFRYSSIYS
jgi:hypothetical protein